MLDRNVLKLLADGEFHSGEQMGKQLEISRAAVWKRLQRLSEQGFPVERVRGKGYRLPQGLELLDADLIEAELAQPLTVEVVEQTASTNDDAMARVRAGELLQPFAILAERQTHGRGRLGRHWQSPFGSNLYLTLVWPLAAGTNLKGLSLVVGLSIIECLQRLGLSVAKLKWPNDVLVNEEKLAGVLIELAGNLESNPVAVIGIGVNGWLDDQLKTTIGQPVTDWQAITGSCLPRNRLVAMMLSQLQENLPIFSRDGFAPFRQDWMQHDCCSNQALWLVRGNHREAVIGRGVDENGGLLVEGKSGKEVVFGGEVSIRWR